MAALAGDFAFDDIADRSYEYVVYFDGVGIGRAAEVEEFWLRFYDIIFSQNTPGDGAGEYRCDIRISIRSGVGQCNE